MTATEAAERLNDAWAVLRCVSHRDVEAALYSHERLREGEDEDGERVNNVAGMPDDLLEIAATIRNGRPFDFDPGESAK